MINFLICFNKEDWIDLLLPRASPAKLQKFFWGIRWDLMKISGDVKRDSELDLFIEVFSKKDYRVLNP